MLIHRRKLSSDKIFFFREYKMHYSVLGEGEPVVLLHGGMHADPWGGFEKLLSGYYQVYLPHLPGFGASDSVGNKLHNIDLFSEAISVFLKKEELKKAKVIAFSLGAAAAIKAFSKYRFSNRLILIGTPLGVESNKVRYANIIPIWLRRMIVSTEWGRDMVLVPVMRDLVGQIDKENDLVLKKDLQTTDVKALVDIDVVKEFKQQIPRLIPNLKNNPIFIYGSQDNMRNLSASIIKKKITIPGATHNIFSSKPKETLEVLRKIIDNASL